jgi:hypothetical protein
MSIQSETNTPLVTTIKMVYFPSLWLYLGFTTSLLKYWIPTKPLWGRQGSIHPFYTTNMWKRKNSILISLYTTIQCSIWTLQQTSKKLFMTMFGFFNITTDIQPTHVLYKHGEKQVKNLIMTIFGFSITSLWKSRFQPNHCKERKPVYFPSIQPTCEKHDSILTLIHTTNPY